MTNTCYLCDAEAYLAYHKTRDIKDISVVKCGECGLVFLSNFDHIDEYFYENNHMLPTEYQEHSEKWQRLTQIDDERRYNFFRRDITNKRILDIGAGAGGFVKVAKQAAKETTAAELSAELRRYMIDTIEGVNVVKEIYDVSGKQYDTIFMFHLLEHLKDPVKILSEAAESLAPDGSIIIEVPNVDDALLTLYDSQSFRDSYYWSCHLYYYNAHTLSKLLSKAGYKIDYIRQVQRYPVSNHLHWLRSGQPGGHEVLNFLNSDILHSEYEKQLAMIGKCDTLVARIRK